MLPRGRLVYRQFDLSDVPAARKAQALALKLDAWQPVPQARFWHGWSDGCAHAWAWPADDPHCAVGDNETPIPETALHSPLAAGHRLVRVSDGYEGQVWRQGQLSLSRWWPQPPEASQWRQFLRAAGSPGAPVPEPETATWSPRPWLKSGSGSNAWWLAHERAVVIGVAALMLLLIGWQGGRLWQVNDAVAEARTQLEQLRQSSADELAARDRALQFSDQAARLVALIPNPRALELLDQTTAVLPDNGRLLEWQHEPTQLVLAFETDRPPNPEQAVRALREVQALDDILAERATPPNALRIQARIRSGPSAP